ncbi:MAG: hypothetical protein ACLR1T_12930 [Evtepia gabavorous]
MDRKNKTALLLEILEQEQVKSALVFTRTKHGADKVARDLTRRGWPRRPSTATSPRPPGRRACGSLRRKAPGPGGHGHRRPGPGH